jgi:hypothetical protein
MNSETGISLAYEGKLTDQPSAPTPIEITVIFTHIAATLAALRKACELAQNLHARIKVLVPQLVPYPLPLTSPPMVLEFSERRFRAIACRQPVDTFVQLYLCRDRDQVLCEALATKSLVVIAGRNHWWPTEEKRMARMLRKRGHEVVLTFMEEVKAHD